MSKLLKIMRSPAMDKGIISRLKQIWYDYSVCLSLSSFPTGECFLNQKASEIYWLFHKKVSKEGKFIEILLHSPLLESLTVIGSHYLQESKLYMTDTGNTAFPGLTLPMVSRH